MTLDPRNYENTERDWCRLVADIDTGILELIAAGKSNKEIEIEVGPLVEHWAWHPNWTEQLRYIYAPAAARIEWLRHHPELLRPL